MKVRMKLSQFFLPFRHLTQLINLIVVLINFVHCNELWMDTNNIVLKINPFDSNPSFWSPIKLCPLGSVVVSGYSFENRDGSNGHGNLRGLTLQCAQWSSYFNSYLETCLLSSGQGQMRPSSISYTAHTYAVGFSFEKWVDSEIGGEPESGRLNSHKSLWEFIFHNDNSISQFQFQIKCPLDWAICGFQAKMGQVPGEESGEFIERIRFKCCALCIPMETEVVIRDVTNNGFTEMTTQIKKIVGAHVEEGSRLSSQKGNTIDHGRETMVQRKDDKSHTKTANQNFQLNFHKNEGQSVSIDDGSSHSVNEGSHNSQTKNVNKGFSFSTNFNVQDGSSVSFSSDKVSISTMAKSEGRSRGTFATGLKNLDFSVDKTYFTGTSKSPSSTLGLSPTGTYDNYVVGLNGAQTLTKTIFFNKQANIHKEKSGSKQLNKHQDKSKEFTEGHEEDRHLGEQDIFSRQEAKGGDENKNENFNDAIQQDFNSDFSNQFNHDLNKGMQIGQDWAKNRGEDQGFEVGDVREVQAMFTSKFGHVTTSSVNWDSTESSQWNEGTEQMDTFTCTPKNRCVLKQIIVQCGQIKLYTPKLIRTNFPLLTSTSKMNVFINGRRQDPTKMSHDTNPHTTLLHEMEPLPETNPGEIWIMAMIPYNKTKIPSKIWEPSQVCSVGSIVVGHRTKFDSLLGFTGWSLQCATEIGLNGHHIDFVDTKEISSMTGKPGHWLGQIRPNSSAVGFSFVEFSMNGQQFRSGHRIEYQMETSGGNVPEETMNVQNIQFKCPANYVLCGIQTMMDKEQIEVVTAIRLKCCYNCLAQEKMVTIHSFKNSGNTMTSHTVKISTGPVASPLDGDKVVVLPVVSNFDALINAEDVRHIRARFIGMAAATQNYFSMVAPEEAFDWNNAPVSIWEKVEESTISFQCEAGQRCVLKQLVGVCGEKRFRTPFTTIDNLMLSSLKNSTVNE